MWNTFANPAKRKFSARTLGNSKQLENTPKHGLRNDISLFFLVIFTVSIVTFNMHTMNEKLSNYQTSNSMGFQFESVTLEKFSLRKHGSPRFLSNMKIIITALVDDYIPWHREQRRKIESGELDPKQVRLLVYRGKDFNAGLGDRIRALVKTYISAVITKRLFLIDWQEPIPITQVFDSPNGLNFTYDPIIFGPELPEETNTDFKYIEKFSFLDLQSILSDERAIIMKDQSGSNCTELFAIRRLYPTIPFSDKLEKISTPNPKCAEIIPFILHTLFQSSNSFKKYIFQKLESFEYGQKILREGADYTESNMNRIQTQYLSVHARLGKWIEPENDRFNLSTKGLTEQKVATCMARLAIQQVEKRGHQEPYRFWLSTDTPPFRSMFKEEIVNLRPLSKVIYGDWDIQHVKDLNKNKGGNLNFMETFFDLYMLSRGTGLLHINSGFANLAKWLGAMTNDDHKAIGLETCNDILQMN